MGGRVGGITSKFYVETRGIKVSGGQIVKAGTVLTRQGTLWKAGLGTSGRNSVTALIDGEVYFTKKKNAYKTVVTYVNVKPVTAAA